MKYLVKYWNVGVLSTLALVSFSVDAEQSYIDQRIDELECILDEEKGGRCEGEKKVRRDLEIDESGVDVDDLHNAKEIKVVMQFEERKDAIYEKLDCSKIPYGHSTVEEQISNSDVFIRNCIPRNDTEHVFLEGEHQLNGLNPSNNHINSEIGYLHELENNASPKTLLNTPLWDDISNYGFSGGHISKKRYSIYGIEYTESDFKKLSCVEVSDEVRVMDFTNGSKELLDRSRSLYEHHLPGETVELVQGAIFGAMLPSGFRVIKRSFSATRKFVCDHGISNGEKLYTQKKVEQNCSVLPITNGSNLESVDYYCDGARQNKIVRGQPTSVPVTTDGVSTYVPYVTDTEVIKSQSTGIASSRDLLSLNKKTSSYGIRCKDSGGVIHKVYPDQVSYSYSDEAGERGWKQEFNFENEAAIKNDGGIIESIDNSAVNSLQTVCSNGIEVVNEFIDENGVKIPVDLYGSYVSYAPVSNTVKSWVDISGYFEKELNSRIEELDGYIKDVKNGNNALDPQGWKCRAAYNMAAGLGDKFFDYIDDNGIEIDLYEEFPSDNPACDSLGGVSWKYQDNPSAIESAAWNYTAFHSDWTELPFVALGGLRMMEAANELTEIKTPAERAQESIAEINLMLAPGSSLDRFLSLSNEYAELKGGESCTDLRKAILGTENDQGQNTGGMLSKLLEYSRGQTDEDYELNDQHLTFNCSSD